MAHTPTPPKGQNVETEKYSTPTKRGYQGGSKASYTPNYAANEFIGGKSGGKPGALGSVPSVQVGNSFEVGQLPTAFTGDFSVGENKNVSTPVSGS